MNVSPSAGRGFRPELHGLRGTAIALVVLYHVFFDRVSGGVDVFLFLSAFLLTGTMVRRLERGEAVRPLGYWAGAFKRLLAPAVVVIAGTLVLVFAFLPPPKYRESLADAAGSLLQVENWMLIARDVDYYADTGAASVFQHFWSLSMQGQIFLLWPLLIAAGGVAARALRRPPRLVLMVLFGALGAASLAWSVSSTATQQNVAYFDTTARAWEFAAGSLLALVLPWIDGRFSADGRFIRLRFLAGWTGLLGLLACGMLVDVESAFPGRIAAWPLVCAALVLLAGRTTERGADALLASRPVAFLGTVSYALYLVHWPLLVIWLQIGGRERAGLLDGAVLIVLSVVLAHLLTRLVDSPVRSWRWANARPWRSGAVAVTTLALGLAPVLTIQYTLDAAANRTVARAAQDHPGAQTLQPGFRAHPDRDPTAGPAPLLTVLGDDWVRAPESCSGSWRPTDPQLAAACGYASATLPAADGGSGSGSGTGGGSGPGTAVTATPPVLVVIGNSRMQQQAGALIPLAQGNGWDVVTLWRGGCPFQPDVEHRTPACNEFNEALEQYLIDAAPQAVATTTTFLTYDGREVTTGGMQEALPRLTERGIDVLAFRDQPRLAADPNTCARDSSADDPRCGHASADMFPDRRADADLLDEVGASAAADGPGTVHPVDLTDIHCPGGRCAPEVGNVRVFRDANHVSATYSRSTGWFLENQLEDADWTW